MFQTTNQSRFDETYALYRPFRIWILRVQTNMFVGNGGIILNSAHHIHIYIYYYGDLWINGEFETQKAGIMRS